MEYDQVALAEYHERLERVIDPIVAIATDMTRGVEQPPRYLYHYTSLQGLMGIVSTKSLWATDARFLNDTQELQWAAEIFDTALVAAEPENDREREFLVRLKKTENLRDLGFTTFCASFSEAEDDLSQWRGYGGTDSGVAIGVSPTKIKAKLPHVELLKVVYDLDTQREIAHDIVGRMLQFYRDNYEDSELANTFFVPRCLRMYRQMTVYAQLRFKSPHWVSEQEWRLISTLGQYDLRDSPNLGFRIGNLGLTPYLKLDLSGMPFAHGLPMQRIVVGPSRYPDLALETVKLYLESAGHFAHLEAVSSAVPLR